MRRRTRRNNKSNFCVSILIVLLLIIIVLLLINLFKSSKQDDNTLYSETTTQSSQELTTNDIDTLQITTTAEVETSNEINSTISAASDSKTLEITVLNQYPELATGCEITSLTMVLNYYGFNVDKCDLADNYLEKGPVGKTDFRKAFEGDPRDPNSFGCYAPVIKNAANKYLSSQGSNMNVTDITGTEFDDLFEYIDNDIPVIVWGTLDCKEGHYSVTWNVDGQDLTWFTPEHCMVLVRYDNINSYAIVADPVHGDVRAYDKELFKSRYNSLQKQAVVITK